ncbi:MAG TPA: acetylxylan esterase [Pirellulales bacterium]|nr:acetylxylan esterase [Pirellulales bacterium]
MEARLACIIGCLWFIGGNRIFADDEIVRQLSQEILPAETGFKELSAYCLAKVPPMPMFANLADWQRHAAKTRQRVLDEIVFRGETRAWRGATTEVEWLESIVGGPGYRIRKLRYEALPGWWIPALLYEPDHLSGRVPATLHVNGHDSDGKAAPYKQIRCINLAKRGMLALNVEFIGMGQLTDSGYSHHRMNQLDLCGASGLAPFYLALQRALDLLLKLPNADPQRVAVAGLSGGGWQTILISALDERVTLANPVAGYTGFRDRALYACDVGDSEQNPTDLGLVADYTMLTALRAPQPTLLTYNAKENCCFNASWALPTVRDAALPVYRLYGRESALRWHVNEDPGTHNFLRDNREAFYRMLGDFFYPGDGKFARTEIPCGNEVKKTDELRVALPESNENFHTLALRLSRNLPRRTWRLPEESLRARQRLGELVRAGDYDLVAETVGQDRLPEMMIRRWRLRMAKSWTVPAVEFEPPGSRGVTVIVADGGRKSLASEARRYVAAGQRVIALDLFDFGESKALPHVNCPLLVSALGDRPLGIEAAQLSAAVRWARQRQAEGTVTLAAVGQRTSLIAIVAAALHHGPPEDGLDRLELSLPLATLRQIIEEDRGAEWPEMFCFGLLEEFDIKPLLALTSAPEITIRAADQRMREAFSDLAQHCRASGKSLELED